MSEFRSYAQCGDPHGVDRCKWCGKKLRQHYRNIRETRADGVPGKIVDKEPYDKKGDYHDGHFCGLRCGYMYGRSVADTAERSK